ESTGSVRMAAPQDVAQIFWSPDSTAIGFVSAFSLKTIGLRSASAQDMANAQGVRGASWGARGSVLFAPDYTSGLYVVSSSGGEARAVTELDRKAGDESHRWPEFLPDGEHFIFVIQSRNAARSGLYFGSLQSKAI